MHESAVYIKISSLILILIFAAGLVSGGIISYLITYPQINELKSEVSNLNARVSKLYGYKMLQASISNTYKFIRMKLGLPKFTKKSRILSF